MLLNFPTEIVQLVLLRCATPDFLHAAVACRALFSIASSTRELLLHHLATTPGPPVDDSDSASESTPELFRTLARRAVVHLYGVESRATVTALNHYSEDDDSEDSIDPAACAVRLSDGPSTAIAVASNRARPVRLYHTSPSPSPSSPTDTDRDTDRDIQATTTLNLPYGLDGCVRARRVVFVNDPADTIAILQHVECAPPNAAQTASVEPAAAPFLSPGRPYVLLFRRRVFSATDEPTFGMTFAQLPDHGGGFGHDDDDTLSGDDMVSPEDSDPVALDVSASLDIAILWRHRRTRSHKIVLYNPDATDFPVSSGICCASFIFSFFLSLSFFSFFSSFRLLTRLAAVVEYFEDRRLNPPLYLKQPLVGLRFNDRGSQLLYHTAGSFIYSYFQIIVDTARGRPGVGSPSSNADRIPLPASSALYSDHNPRGPSGSVGSVGSVGASRQTFAINIPFFCAHQTYTPDGGGPDMCRWQYLALAFYTQRQPAQSKTPPLGVLVRAEAHCHAWRCNHCHNLDRGRRLRDWTVVARLRDFHPEAPVQNSLTATTVASERGTRLAIAVGTTIRIWALEPTQLLARNASGYYPPEMLLTASPNASPDAADDDAHPIVDLSPITLRANAVVSALTFVCNCEDRLVAITDRGVEVWVFRPQTPGLRRSLPLIDTPPRTYSDPSGEDAVSKRRSGDGITYPSHAPPR